jgi:hypothetical protein
VCGAHGRQSTKSNSVCMCARARTQQTVVHCPVVPCRLYSVPPSTTTTTVCQTQPSH